MVRSPNLENGRSIRNSRPPIDVADLDALVGRNDAQQGLPALRSPGGAIDHGEVEGIGSL